jgi:hypothetical protein
VRRAGITQPRAARVAVALVALVVLWLVRPIWHGLALFAWTEPLVWLAPLALLVAGGVLLRRSQRSWTTLEDLRTGVRPPMWLLAFPALAFVAFIFVAAFNGPLVGRAIVNATTYEAIDGLPPGGIVRLVPREVAEQNASSAFKLANRDAHELPHHQHRQGTRLDGVAHAAGRLSDLHQEEPGHRRARRREHGAQPA